MVFIWSINEPRYDKNNNVAVRPAKTQIILGIRPVWSESSLSAWTNLRSLATHWAHSEDWSDWAQGNKIYFKGTWFMKQIPPWGSHNEPRHYKTDSVAVRPAKTQISLGIRPVCSESSLSAWANLRSLATHWAHSEDSDQTGRMPRLIWVFAGRTATLSVL